MEREQLISPDILNDEEFKELSAPAQLTVFKILLWRKSGRSKIFRYSMRELTEVVGLPEADLTETMHELAASQWLVWDEDVMWLRHGLRFNFVQPLKCQTGIASVLNELDRLPAGNRVRVQFMEHYAVERPSNTPSNSQSNTPSNSGSNTQEGAEQGSDQKNFASIINTLPGGEGLVSNSVSSEPVSKEEFSPHKNINTPAVTKFSSRRERSAEEREEEKRIKPACDVPIWPVPWGQRGCLFALYNARRPENWREARLMSEGRAKVEKKYLKQWSSQKFWEEVFERVKESPFLTGKVAGAQGIFHSMDIAFILQKGKDGFENCIKIWEGRYSGARHAEQQAVPKALLLEDKWAKIAAQNGIAPGQTGSTQVW